MPSDETRQLARVAAVTDDLDKALDKLFAHVADLKLILAPDAAEPGAWANLGKEGEAMPAQPPPSAPVPPTARETVDATDRLTASLAGMAGQLKATASRLDVAERAALRSRRVMAALALSLALDVTLTVVVTVFALQAHGASDRAAATAAQVHAAQVATCLSSNQTRAQEIQLWNHLAQVSAASPAPHLTPRQLAQNKTEVAALLAYIRKTFAPRKCRLPSRRARERTHLVMVVETGAAPGGGPVLVRVQNPVTRTMITLDPPFPCGEDDRVTEFTKAVAGYCQAAWVLGRLDPAELSPFESPYGKLWPSFAPNPPQEPAPSQEA